AGAAAADRAFRSSRSRPRQRLPRARTASRPPEPRACAAFASSPPVFRRVESREPAWAMRASTTTARTPFGSCEPRPCPGTPVLQEQSHLDDVPELAARSAHVLLSVALVLEAELPVQGDGCLVVRKDAQRQLVQPLFAAPVDRSRNERRADA